MVVKDDLLLQVVTHLRAYSVRLVDPLRDRAVAIFELVEGVHLLFKVVVFEDELIFLAGPLLQ